MYSYAQCGGMCVSVCKIAFNHDMRTGYYKDVQIPWIYFPLFPRFFDLFQKYIRFPWKWDPCARRTRDGIRKEFKEEFSYIYIYIHDINDVRANAWFRPSRSSW